jgi:hypothetical protein
MKVPASLPLVALAALGVLGAAWALTRPGAAAGAGEAMGRALIEGADGAIRGTVVAAGELVGIPDTNADQCTIDLAAGDLWAASFSCPAPRYLKAVATGDYGAKATGNGAEGSW